MNILLVLTGLPDKKSPARSVFNLVFIEELKKKGIKITILYLRALHPKHLLIKEKEINGSPCYEVRTTIPQIGPLKDSYFSSTIFSFLLKNKNLSGRMKNIDAIHAIGGKSIEASYLISKKFNIPMISQFIGSDLNKFFLELLAKKNFLNGISRSEFLCFNSKGLKDVFLSKINNRRNKKVLYRGVKLDDFEYGFTLSSNIDVLFLGGFPNSSNLKGGITLIDSIKLLNNEILSVNMRISIGGPNSLAFKNKFEEVSNPNLEVDFIGAIDKIEVKNRMKKSHIVVIPSLAEGLPNVLYESMASGNMVIASEVGGIPEIIDDRVTGRLIPPDSPAALADVLFEVTNNLSLIEHYAINGRKRIESLDYDKFIDNYIHLYKTVTNLAK